MQTNFSRTERASGYCEWSCKTPSPSSSQNQDRPKHTTRRVKGVPAAQIYYQTHWEQVPGGALRPSVPPLHGIDFSSFLPQVGMNDLTVVNLHLALSPSPGENTGKNHDSHKLAAFAQTLQETLKGTGCFFLPAVMCAQVILSNQKELK